MTTPDLFDPLASDARVSPCGRYRYTLERRWSRAARLLWVMLNPSTADAERDDPTIRRCVGFARAWGYGGITVVNLFAWRATDPSELRDVADPVGPENNEVIEEALNAHASCVAAWGQTKYAEPLRVSLVEQLASGAGRALYCLGVNKDGSPKHPLFVPGTARLRAWP